MRKFIYLFVLFVLCSCSVSRHAPRTETIINVRDSVVIRDSTVYVEIPVESHSDSLEIAEDAYSHLETGVAVSDAWTVRGMLFHKIYNKDWERLPVVVPIVTRASVRTETTTITKTVEVEKELTQWQIIQIWAGRLLLILSVIYIVIKALRHKING